MDKWDDQLRASMTKQLKSDENIIRWSCLSVPPGYVLEPSTLEKLMDISVVLPIAENIRQFPSAFARLCVTRFIHSLKGYSLMFFDED